MGRFIIIAVACMLAGASSMALAEDGYVTGDVNLRAGPDTDYPPVDTIPAGEPVAVQGCIDGFEWCDVIWGEERGWVAGNYIEYEYNDRPVLLPAYGAVIGIPIVSFVIADYWGRYYHNRPFYGERNRWFSRGYVHHAAPRPFGGPLHDYGHGHGSAHNFAHGTSHGPSGHADYHGSGAHAVSHVQSGHPDYHGNAQTYHGQTNHNAAQAYHGPTNHDAGHGSTNHNAAQTYHAPNNGGNHAPQAQAHHDAPKHDDHKDKDHGH